jgi:hypothetical protein
MKAFVAATSIFLQLVIPAMAETNTTKAPPSAESTAPDNRGTTGWTGGTRDQKTQEDPAVEARLAADQPFMAEGLDLRIPARQFSPKKTVE